MNRVARFFRRWLMPVWVFLLVGAAHYVYFGFFPDEDPAQARWVGVSAPERAGWTRYVETQSYWLGYCYGLSLSFAAVALRRYREKRSCGARNLAVGGVTFSGVLAVVGCYLLGCCGSPMLAVYLNLFRCRLSSAGQAAGGGHHDGYGGGRMPVDELERQGQRGAGGFLLLCRRGLQGWPRGA